MSVQAGIAGLGRWGRRLTESIETSSVIQFTAGCTGRRAHAVDYCSEKGIDLRDSLDDLLNDPVIDAIILATPHTQHAEQIIASAKAGKHGGAFMSPAAIKHDLMVMLVENFCVGV